MVTEMDKIVKLLLALAMLGGLLILAACAETGTKTIETPSKAVSQTVMAEAVDMSQGDILVTVLGSGTPIPTADQFGASILVQASGKDLLFDCGRGCTTRLVQVDRKLITRLRHLFLTHLHSDHVVGVDDLWLNGWTQGRNDPMVVYGPPGTEQFFVNLKKAFEEDINIRIKKGLPATTDGINMAMTDISSDQVVFDEDGVKVTAFLVDHRPVEPAFGYRVDYAGRSVVISGDTKPSENLVKNSMNADVILHEVFSPSMVNYVRTNFTEEQYQAIVGIHTTSEQAGEIFTQTKPRLAVYYHIRLSPKDIEDMISVTGEIYDGPVEVSRDLYQISIGDDIKTSVLK